MGTAGSDPESKIWSLTGFGAIFGVLVSDSSRSQFVWLRPVKWSIYGPSYRLTDICADTDSAEVYSERSGTGSYCFFLFFFSRIF